MPKKPPYIAEFEELVILAILKLGDNAYGASIYEALEDAGRSTAVGALYTTLSRLEEKGLLTSRVGEATPERGGRAKRYFKVQGSAVRALRKMEASRRKLQSSLIMSGGVA